MMYLSYFVSVVIILKWLADLFCFILSAVWFTRQKKKYVKTGMFDSTKVEIQKTYGGSKAEKTVWGGMKYFINGVNKCSNNTVASIPFHGIRNFIYKKCLKVDVGSNVVIYKGTVFRDGYKCSIGKGTIIGDDNLIDARGGLSIGKNCNFSTGVRIWTAQHNPQNTGFAYESAPVRVGSRCWISSNVTLLPGVTVGDGCVIASGAVVTKDCEAYGFYGGVPAKKIGERNKEIDYVFNGSHDYFL